MKSLLCASLLLLLSNISFAAQQSIGSVILSFGQNTAVSDVSGERKLKRKSDVYADDLLKTGAKGRLQIRFSDGSRLSLKPDTEFKIAEYQFESDKPEEGKAIYKLLKGGMRTISGQIGKVDKEDYKLDAVVATIGIRGTDFSINKVGDKVSGSVASGKINVAAKQGANRDIAKGRSFQLTGPKGAISVFKTPPSEQPEGEENKESSEESSEESDDTGTEDESEESSTQDSEESESSTNGTDESASSEQNSTESTASDSTSASDSETPSSTSSLSLDTSLTTTSDSSAGTVPASNPTSEGGQAVVIAAPDPTGVGEAAPTGSVVALSFTENEPGKGLRASSGRVEVNGQSAITVDSSIGTGDLVTGLVYIDQNSTSSDNCSPCTMSGPSNAGNVVNNSNKTLGGSKVTWGRWATGFTVIENGVQSETTGSFHFMFADNLTPNSVMTSKTGDFVYRLESTAGAYTNPEIETGATGTLNDFVGSGGTNGHLYSGTYFRVDFDTQKLLEIGIEANVSGGSYKLREEVGADLSLSNVLNGNDVKLAGTCTGGSCSGGTTDLSGRMTIDFVGSAGEGAITSYGASGTNASTGTTATISGTILLEGTTSP